MDASVGAISRVLVAEKNEGDRQLLLACLKRLHCSATVATDRAGAIAALQQERFEVLLASADILQEGEGIAARSVRELSRPGARLPVVVLVATEGDRPVGMRMGARACLVKPVRLSELQATLQQVSRAESETKEKVPLLDERVLASARKMAGKRGASVVRDLVTAYLEDLPGFVEAIRQAIAMADEEALRQTAHRLRSSSASVGAARLARAAELLECLGKSADLSDAGELFSRVEVEVADAIEILQQIREPLSS